MSIQFYGSLGASIKERVVDRLNSEGAVSALISAERKK